MTAALQTPFTDHLRCKSTHCPVKGAEIPGFRANVGIFRPNPRKNSTENFVHSMLYNFGLHLQEQAQDAKFGQLESLTNVSPGEVEDLKLCETPRNPWKEKSWTATIYRRRNLLQNFRYHTEILNLWQCTIPAHSYYHLCNSYTDFHHSEYSVFPRNPNMPSPHHHIHHPARPRPSLLPKKRIIKDPSSHDRCLDPSRRNPLQ